MRKATHLLNIVIRVLVILALLGGGLLVYSTCAGGKVIQRIDRTLPDVSAAPFKVSTVTHIYYARRADQNEDGSVTMSSWYNRQNGKWTKQPGEITLKAVLRPRIGKR